MKISYNWIQTYFKEDLPNPKDLADLLNIRAFEVEDVEEKDGDSVFEIKITPNRAPDCLSHRGVAKEISIHAKKDLQIDETPQVAVDFSTQWNVEVQKDSCIRYMMREIQNVVVKESPIELKQKLESIGQRSINNIVDITNLVMHEIGQPMHAFDADKLSGKIIKVAEPVEKHFVTLDNKEVELIAEDLTIQDEKDNLAIAGVKGGKKAEVDGKTKNIILESANFFPVKVRTTSKRTGIQTDSSKRYENGLTPDFANIAINLASHYFQKYASGSSTKFSNIIDIYPRPQKRKYVVGLDISQIKKKLNISIEQKDLENIFEKLGIEYLKVNSREEILKHANFAIGKPYFYGSSVLFDSPDKFDCASLTAYVYSMGGIAIPRISIDQFVFSKKITKEDAKPGDLIFANTGNTVQHGIWYESKEFLPGTKVSEGVDHVGIYIGDNKVLHANSKTENVAVEDLNESEYFKNITGFGSCIDSDQKYLLQIPYERLDLRTEIDIIEEIGRIYGYEHIVPEVINLPIQDKVSIYQKINTIKSHLYDLGIDEVITYTFGKKGDIGVIKPLANDKANLRNNLKTGLMESLELNFKNKDLFAEDVVKIYEIGNVFADGNEKMILGIAAKSSNKKNKSKDILTNIFQYLSDKLGIKIDISINDQDEVIEIDLESIIDKDFEIYNSLYVLPHNIYEPFSLYPFMTRDIAVWANKNKNKSDIEEIIKKESGELLLRYDLFDEFKKDERTSYAYRLIFQSFERTLTDDEINPIMDKIYTTLKADSDYEIR